MNITVAGSIKSLSKLENLCLDLAGSEPYGEDWSDFMSILTHLKHLRVLAVNYICS